MFQQLTQRIHQAIKKLKGQDQITAHNIAPTLKEIRRALIEADVHYKIAKEFVEKVKNKAVGTTIKISASPGQMFTKIVENELAQLMGGQETTLEITGKPAIVLVVGLQGAGKTTFVGKLASRLTKQGKEVLLTSCDVYRPAAIEQLKILSEQLKIDSYLDPTEKDPFVIAQKAVEVAKEQHKKVLIVDTAGRQSIDEKMMEEVVQLKQQLKPSETLFVVDAMMGQVAVDIATTFHEQLQFDGVVLTKMDGDTRGGAAISIQKATGKPVKLLSTGEKMIDLQVFHPDRMAKRILGMTDITSFVERAEEIMSEEEANKLSAKLKKQKLDFNDFLQQLSQLKRMGNLQSLLGAIPMVKNMVGNPTLDQDAFKPFEYMIQSMTPKERSNPDLLYHNHTRINRLAKGSGLPKQTISQLLKRFAKLQQMSKKLNNKKEMEKFLASTNQHPSSQ